jgi:hypothetical protein
MRNSTEGIGVGLSLGKRGRRIIAFNLLFGPNLDLINILCSGQKTEKPCCLESWLLEFN